MATSLDEQLLAALSSGDVADSCAWAAAGTPPLDHQAVVGAMKSLEAEGYVVGVPSVTELWKLTAEAEGYVTAGSPEAQLFHAIGPDGMSDAELEAAVPKEILAIGKGKAMQRKWIAKDKATNKYKKIVRKPRCTLWSLHFPGSWTALLLSVAVANTDLWGGPRCCVCADAGRCN